MKIHESLLRTVFSGSLLQSCPVCMHTLNFVRIGYCYDEGKHVLLQLPKDLSAIILDDNFIFMFRMMERVGSQ